MKIKNLVFALLSCLCLQATAQENIVDRLNKTLGIRLPAEYEATVREFVNTNKTLKKQIAADFTEQYIIKEMKTSWVIDRQNKLLFVWCAIGYNYNQNFYTGDDGNKKRMDDFEAVLDSVEACQNRYKDEFIAYMEQRSAEAQQRSAEAQQRSAEAQQRSAEYREETINNLIISLNAMKDYYYYWKIDSSLMSEKDLKDAQADAKKTIQLCKDYCVDYKSILSSEILKFYGVE